MSFIKWVGGKGQIVDKVIEKFPDVIEGDYYEPFLGGGSVLLAFLRSGKECLGRVRVSDINQHLIELYKTVQQTPDRLIDEIDYWRSLLQTAPPDGPLNRSPKSLEEGMASRESLYYWARSEFNRKEGDKSALFLFLNKTCFRGLYREGPRGFNVPYGNYKNPSIFNPDEILSISALIANVEFISTDFREALAEVGPRDFVYLDPPYVPEKIGSFVGYTDKGFPGSSHQALFDWVKGTSANWLLSNSATPLVLEEFVDYDTQIISCRRAINSKKPSARTNEVLIQKNES